MKALVAKYAKDRGTWVGLMAVLSMIGVNISPANQGIWIGIGTGVAGLVLLLWPDSLDGRSYGEYLMGVLKERSSWMGALAVVAAVGMAMGWFTLGDAQIESYAQVAVGIVGIVYMLFNGKAKQGNVAANTDA